MLLAVTAGNTARNSRPETGAILLTCRSVKLAGGEDPSAAAYQNPKQVSGQLDRGHNRSGQLGACLAGPVLHRRITRTGFPGPIYLRLRAEMLLVSVSFPCSEAHHSDGLSGPIYLAGGSST